MPHGIEIESIVLEPGSYRKLPAWKLIVRNNTGHNASVCFGCIGRDEHGNQVASQGAVALELRPSSVMKVTFNPCGSRRVIWTLETMSIFWAGSDGMLVSTSRVSNIGMLLGSSADEDALALWRITVPVKLFRLLTQAFSAAGLGAAGALRDSEKSQWLGIGYRKRTSIITLFKQPWFSEFRGRLRVLRVKARADARSPDGRLQP
jgi:hypothetical protein